MQKHFLTGSCRWLGDFAYFAHMIQMVGERGKEDVYVVYIYQGVLPPEGGEDDGNGSL